MNKLTWMLQRSKWRDEVNRLEELLRRTEDPTNTEAFAAALSSATPAGGGLRNALEEIGSMTYDQWSNGYKAGEIARAALAASPVPLSDTGAQEAMRRDALLNAAIEFIGTLTGMKPPPIEVAPPEVFAPFRAFVANVEAIIKEHQ